jgi:hypothetical protein
MYHFIRFSNYYVHYVYFTLRLSHTHIHTHTHTHTHTHIYIYIYIHSILFSYYRPYFDNNYGLIYLYKVIHLITF